MNQDDTAASSAQQAERRSFFVQLGAIVCGALVALFPFVVGLGVIIDPWRRVKRATAGGTGQSAAKFIRICPLDSLPADGVPRAFPAVTDVVDAWTRTANQRIGMIFISRADTGGKPNVTAFNARCPHLGCFVDFNSTDSHFECPCHKSAFDKDGVQLFGPSRRGLDRLDVKIENSGNQSEVLVAFQNFQTGIPERKPVE